MERTKERTKEGTKKSMADKLQTQQPALLLIAYFERYIQRVKLRGSAYTVANYENSLGALRRYQELVGVEPFLLVDLTAEWVVGYTDYLQGNVWIRKGDNMRLRNNSIAFYLRTLRTVYNAALADHVLERPEHSPFEKRFASNPTAKRFLTVEEVKSLIKIDLSNDPSMAEARDVFLFLLFARGMCFIDLFNLKWSDVDAHYLQYERSKTGVELCVQLIPELKMLLDRQRRPDQKEKDYVFASLHVSVRTGKMVSEATALRRINRRLSALGLMVGIKRILTTYISRHTWATLQEESGQPISIISRGLGHRSDRVTQIYMGGISQQKIDGANDGMINLFFREDMMEMENKNDSYVKNSECLIPCMNKT
ncbi:MAG: site-specific integrase [Tannerellaceae bacterium]